MPDAKKPKQPRCPTCGRFARWDALSREWRLTCIFWDDYMGAYEHA